MNNVQYAARVVRPVRSTPVLFQTDPRTGEEVLTSVGMRAFARARALGLDPSQMNLTAGQEVARRSTKDHKVLVFLKRAEDAFAEEMRQPEEPPDQEEPTGFVLVEDADHLRHASAVETVFLAVLDPAPEGELIFLGARLHRLPEPEPAQEVPAPEPQKLGVVAQPSEGQAIRTCSHPGCTATFLQEVAWTSHADLDRAEGDLAKARVRCPNPEHHTQEDKKSSRALAAWKVEQDRRARAAQYRGRRLDAALHEELRRLGLR